MRWAELKAKLKWLDPFTYVDMLLDKYNPSHNQWVDLPVYLISAFVFAFIIYTVLGLLLGTPTPMVIVISQSMEPTMYRGDVVVLTGVTAADVRAPEVTVDQPLALEGLAAIADVDYTSRRLEFLNGNSLPFEQIGSGDIIVYHSVLSVEPVIHRAIAKVSAADGTYLVTKGDNNQGVDQDCGILRLGIPSKPCISPYLATDGIIDGKSVFRIPLIGYAKLILFDDLPALLTGQPIPSFP